MGTREQSTSPRAGETADAPLAAERPAASDLVAWLAALPGLVRPGIPRWDMTTRLPLHPLAVENANGDPRLVPALAIPGARRSPTGWTWTSSSASRPVASWLAAVVALAGNLPIPGLSGLLGPAGGGT